jgi:hypothetical protein
MFSSTVLDVAIGLVFTFLSMSLAVSSITEAVASVFRWRSNTLLNGVADLLNDPKFCDLALKVYNHALVHPRGDGQAMGRKDLISLPAYIDPRHFANALIEVAGIVPGAPEAIKAQIQRNVADPQLQALLGGMVDRTEGKIGGMQREIAGWFDAAMDRVGGSYKRRIQFWSFLIAFALAVGLNVNSIEIGRALWLHPMLVEALKPVEGMKPETYTAFAGEVADLKFPAGFPVGWTGAGLDRFCTLSPVDQVESLFGWLITAVATLFGAPFWFDILQRAVRLKGTGPSPAEKQSGAGAAA